MVKREGREALKPHDDGLDVAYSDALSLIYDIAETTSDFEVDPGLTERILKPVLEASMLSLVDLDDDVETYRVSTRDLTDRAEAVLLRLRDEQELDAADEIFQDPSCATVFYNDAAGNEYVIDLQNNYVGSIEGRPPSQQEA